PDAGQCRGLGRRLCAGGAAASYPPPAVARSWRAKTGRRTKMKAATDADRAGFDLASVQDRIQSEVQRALARSIKGVEYFSTSGPSLGSTPKDILSVRGTMNLYHYRPMVDELYRVPILIV